MKYLYTVLPAALFLFIPSLLDAQHDESYYVSYEKILTTRFYFSQKYTSLILRNRKDNSMVRYFPNTTLNMGVGASYKWATLNLAYGWGFLNREDEKGKTKYLDLQFHGYGEKFNLDVVGQFYRGFYVSPKGSVIPEQYYSRPDLRVNAMGASFQYIFNHRRFSFRAATLQTAWQKKSAGTLLMGVEIYGGRIRSDSTLIPTAINQGEAELNEKKTVFFELGPNVGYAYTWVIDNHFFLNGSVSASLDYGFSTVVNQTGEHRRLGFSPNTLLRVNAGYNSARWAISLVYVNNGLSLAGRTDSREAILNVGNVRLNYVHRFVLGKKEKKILEGVIK